MIFNNIMLVYELFIEAWNYITIDNEKLLSDKTPIKKKLFSTYEKAKRYIEEFKEKVRGETTEWVDNSEKIKNGKQYIGKVDETKEYVISLDYRRVL